MTSAADLSAAINLRKLLSARFRTSRELRSFLLFSEVGGVPIGEMLVDELPGPDVPVATYIADAVEALMRRGLIGPAFMGALEGEGPGAVSQGREVASGLTSTALEEAPPPVEATPDPFGPFACFVGRQRELEAVSECLRGGRSVVLVGGRRAGKTALSLELRAVKLGRRLRRVDVAAWPGGDEGSLIAWLGRSLGVTCTEREHLEGALSALAPLSLVVDEAERLLGHPWTNPFLAWLRYLDDQRLGTRLSLLLIGGPELARYRDDQDPSYPGGSPVLNTAQWVYLEPLHRDARVDLAGRLGRPVELAPLFRAVGGHPWLLTQVLSRMWHGSSLVEALNEVGRQIGNHVRTWERQAGPEALKLLMELLPADGAPVEAFRIEPVEGELADWTDELNTLEAMCLVDVVDGRVTRGPSIVLRRWAKQGRKV